MVSGESHYFLGRRYRLRVMEHDGPPGCVLRNKSSMDLYVRPEAAAEQREQVLHRWYRAQLKDPDPAAAGEMAARPGRAGRRVGRQEDENQVGSCNIDARRIWFNLELAKKPVRCLEYIVVHELVHLLERHHNDRFTALMDRFLPQWRSCRDELNRAPLAHETWNY